MTPEGLYSEHWILAYEALVQEWLPSLSGRDYVSDDPYFSILKRHEVRFFDNSNDLDVPEDEGYNDDDHDEEEEDDEEEEQDEGEYPISRHAFVDAPGTLKTHLGTT